MRITRLAIAFGLAAGVAGFGFYTINDLMNNRPVPAVTDPNPFGTANAPPANYLPADDQTLASLLRPDPNQYDYIDERENPHPGEIYPYRDAPPYGVAPFRLPDTGNQVWEFCHYSLPAGDHEAVIAYYASQAQRMGLHRETIGPTSDEAPGGLVASWTNGRQQLEVTAWPIPSSEPVAPPLRPTNPVQWVVKYIDTLNPAPR